MEDNTSACREYDTLFEKVDSAVAKIHRFRIEPYFSQEVSRREGLIPNFDLSDEVILRKLVVMIAHSNNARANAVTKLINSGVLDEAFQKFNVNKVAHLDSADIVRMYWPQIKVIRFKNKIGKMIDCATILLEIESEYGSFMNYLKARSVPPTIGTIDDLENFWNGFDQVRTDLQLRRVPYFGNFTSLCHLFLHLGYDCAKPDSGVMKAAAKLQIVVPPSKVRTFEEKERRKVIEFIQIYAMCRGIRASVVDLYFLIIGRQTSALQLVSSSYNQEAEEQISQ